MSFLRKKAITYQKIRIKFFSSSIPVIYFFASLHLNAQTFPLRLSKDGKYIVTKKGNPFLINGRVADIFHNFQAETTNIPRYQYLGINTAFIFLPNKQTTLNQNGKLSKNLKKDLRTLKRFTREASLYNVAVFVVMAKSDDTASAAYVKFHYKTLRKKKNVAWLFGKEMTGNIDISPKKYQLRGLWINQSDHQPSMPSTYDFVTSTDYTNSSKPYILYQKQASINDSTTDAVRRTAYWAMLNGANGIITDQTHASHSPLYTSLAYQLRHLKNIVDSLPWQSLDPYPEITVPEVTFQKKATASINKDLSLAVVYMLSPFTLQLNLNALAPKLRFIWINPVTGKEFKTIIEHYPSSQLFLPPLLKGKKNDWLLVIKPLQ